MNTEKPIDEERQEIEPVIEPPEEPEEPESKEAEKPKPDTLDNMQKLDAAFTAEYKRGVRNGKKKKESAGNIADGAGEHSGAGERDVSAKKRRRFRFFSR
jgi:hypothetical protein